MVPHDKPAIDELIEAVRELVPAIAADLEQGSAALNDDEWARWNNKMRSLNAALQRVQLAADMVEAATSTIH